VATYAVAWVNNQATIAIPDAEPEDATP